MARFNGWRLTRAGIVFIIVAILLAVTVFGVVRFIQQRGEQVRQDEATEIALQNQEEQSNTPIIAEETPANEGGEAATTEEGATAGQQGQQGGATSGSSTDSSTPQTGTTELPATGIESFVPIVVLAMVAFGAAHLIQNRRTQSQN